MVRFRVKFLKEEHEKPLKTPTETSDLGDRVWGLKVYISGLGFRGLRFRASGLRAIISKLP